MIADVVLPWNGDLDLLTDQQRDALVDLLLGMAVGHDPEKLAELKCHLMEQASAANEGKPYSRTNPTTIDQLGPVLIEGHVEQFANGNQVQPDFLHVAERLSRRFRGGRVLKIGRQRDAGQRRQPKR